jgi:hypothetical protein
MPLLGRFALLPVAAWLMLGTMSFGQEPIKLLRLKNLSRTADAMPRISHPSPAQAKINRELALIDVRARSNATSCHGLSAEGDEMFFSRSIGITSQGPLFMNMDISDEIGCGGVHPYFNQFTFTYNLHTGEQVHWVNYLTKGKVEEIKVNPGNMLPIEIPGVRSLTLQRLYSAGWKDQGQCRIDDVIDPSPEYLTSFLLSPAPHKGGLSVLPTNLANVSAPCGLPVILGKSAMEELGIPEDMQKELLAGQ